jgi:hypothetical protein
MTPMTRVRPPAVAGRFYPDDPRAWRAEARAHLAAGPGERGAEPSGTAGEAEPCLGAVLPHAGWIYSGDVAGRTLATIQVPKTVIVLCPNHTGRGAPIAVAPSGAFALPGGEVPVAEAVAAALLAACPGARADWVAHAGEHAIEVELPLLSLCQPELTIVPVVIGGVGEAECLALGDALAKVVRSAAEPILLVASSDMNHFLDEATTRHLDARALERLLALDAAGLYRRVHGEGITMCGVLPATAMLRACVALGATRAKLVAYDTSASASGDTSRVVGYAGVTVA